jgi:hypothetical protein
MVNPEPAYQVNPLFGVRLLFCPTPRPRAEAGIRESRMVDLTANLHGVLRGSRDTAAPFAR